MSEPGQPLQLDCMCSPRINSCFLPFCPQKAGWDSRTAQKKTKRHLLRKQIDGFLATQAEMQAVPVGSWPPRIPARDSDGDDEQTEAEAAVAAARAGALGGAGPAEVQQLLRPECLSLPQPPA
jgi:hypothetical protein